MSRRKQAKPRALKLGLTIITVTTVFIYLYKAAYGNFDHFEKIGIPTYPVSAFIGSFAPVYLRQVNVTEFIQNVYNYVKDAKIIGVFDMKHPIYFLRDPDLIKQVAVKDFEHFVDHRSVLDEKLDPLIGNNLVNLNGHKWKDMRATLSPMFTGSKLRQMFDFIVEIGEQMSEYFKHATAEDRVVEMKDTASRFTMDVIATTNFGVKINSLADKDNAFYKKVKKIMNFTGFFTQIRFICIMFLPWVTKLFNIQFLPDSKTNFLKKIIEETMDQREKQKLERPDLIQLMLQLKKGQVEVVKDSSKDDAGFATVSESEIGQRKIQRKWSDNELMAQAFVFFLAGFETVASVGSLIAYELALNPKYQVELQKEIDGVVKELNGKPVTYEILLKMKYLDQVVSEGLRLWTPTDNTDRLCVKDYKMKNDLGQEFTIKKGESVWFPITAIHLSEKYYENPRKFNPDRFSDENKGKINPGAYFPFGIGPRACIGSRFALIELKCMLYHLVRDFSFEVTGKTDIPLKFQKVVGKITENGIWLELKPRKK